MNDQDVIRAVREQLAIDLNCSPSDFSGEGFVFCEAIDHPDRRPLPRAATHFQMLTMGGATIVSATKDILPAMQEMLHDKSRDEAFAMPFVITTSHYFYYLPGRARVLAVPEQVELTLIEKPFITELYSVPGNFKNALQYDPNHARPDVLAFTATIDGVVAGMAGASEDCSMLWQIGIDVLPDYRQMGLASLLTNRLANEILKHQKVPYYGTSSSNIASLRTALSAGFTPAWVSVWKAQFDGIETAATE